jgi:hypothetical protein
MPVTPLATTDVSRALFVAEPSAYRPTEFALGQWGERATV